VEAAGRARYGGDRLTGAQFEIIVDGVSRSFRDDKAIALDAARFLKERQPTQAVSVRDMRNGTVVDIGWEAGKAFVKGPN
jgi:hypothetical protein